MQTFQIIFTFMGFLASFTAGIATSQYTDHTLPVFDIAHKHPTLCLRLPLGLLLGIFVWHVLLVPAIMLILCAAVYVLPPVAVRAVRQNFHYFGFTKNGIVSGSYAARWQSGWYGGHTPRSSLFAKLNTFATSLYTNGHNGNGHHSN